MKETMLTPMRRLVACSAALVLIASGCGSPETNRSEALETAALQTIVPAYDAFAVDAAALDLAVVEFCAAPSFDGLSVVGAAIADTHRSWATTETMWIGPVMDRRSWAVIDWPIDADEIDELLADTSIALDAERIGQRIGADQRGLGAIEHLIETSDGLTAFDDSRRCDYMLGITAVITSEADAVVGDWTVGFEGADPWTDLIGADADANVDALVNDAVFMLEATADAELGTALGETDRDQDLDAIVEGALGLGVEELRGRIAGLGAVFVGTPGAPGLSGLLGEDLATRLDEQIATADAALADIDGSLGTAVVERPADVSAARAAIKAVQVTFSTEVVSRLGVTIGFSDADGDTGG